MSASERLTCGAAIQLSHALKHLDCAAHRQESEPRSGWPKTAFGVEKGVLIGPCEAVLGWNRAVLIGERVERVRSNHQLLGESAASSWPLTGVDGQLSHGLDDHTWGHSPNEIGEHSNAEARIWRAEWPEAMRRSAQRVMR